MGPIQQPFTDALTRYVERARKVPREPQPWQANGATLEEIRERRWSNGRPLHPDYWAENR